MSLLIPKRWLISTRAAWVAPRASRLRRKRLRSVTLGDKAIHWALLLVGDARLQGGFSHSPNLKYNKIFVSPVFPPAPPLPVLGDQLVFISYPGQAQLFSGVLRPGGTAQMGGFASSSFSNNSIDRTAVSLPYYGEGNLSMLDAKTNKRIVNVLHTTPTVPKPKLFTVNVSAGQLAPFQTVIQVE